MSASDDNLAELRDALRADAAGVAEALLGPPNKAASTKKTLRWASKGSLSLKVAKGVWYSHESGEGSDLIGLIRRVKGCDHADALKWASDFTGIAIKGAAKDDAQTAQRRAQQEDDRRAQRAEQDAIQAAETAAEQDQRINVARRIAAATVPVAGTLADHYPGPFSSAGAAWA